MTARVSIVRQEGGFGLGLKIMCLALKTERNSSFTLSLMFVLVLAATALEAWIVPVMGQQWR